MGTWGVKTFENDGASDWLWELEESDDNSVLVAALNPEDMNYLEAPDGEIILAAAEIIQAIKNKSGDGLPENALNWINAHNTLDVSSLVTKAITMVDRVLSDNSELRELWEENKDDYPNWHAHITELRSKLNS
ncbi:MAG: DUF4259 domain-containing protein [Candidatus Eremiobacterota bacterium]